MPEEEIQLAGILQIFATLSCDLVSIKFLAPADIAVCFLSSIQPSSPWLLNAAQFQWNGKEEFISSVNFSYN